VKLMTTLALLGAALMPDMADAKSSADCAAIDALISANEEFVESILEDNPKARVTMRKEMETGLAGLGKHVSDKARADSQAAIAQLDAAPNDEAAMLAAMQNYAVVVAEFKARLPTTQKVAMLDHAGFSLQALTAGGSPDWEKVNSIKSALTRNVQDITRQVGKGPLADVLTHTSESIESAIAGHDPKWLKASAQILLDTVDLVEAAVKNPSPAACR
jgi:hypothetical protein